MARCRSKLPSSQSNRILSPTLSALLRVAKPEIPAAVEYFGMKIAPYLSLQEEYDEDDDGVDISPGTSHDATEKAYQFCNQHGYPILVKGKKQGAAVAYSWLEVAAAMTMRWVRFAIHHNTLFHCWGLKWLYVCMYVCMYVCRLWGAFCSG